MQGDHLMRRPSKTREFKGDHRNVKFGSSLSEQQLSLQASCPPVHLIVENGKLRTVYQNCFNHLFYVMSSNYVDI